MPYTVKETKVFDAPFEEVYKSLVMSVEAMNGKILVNDQENRRLEAHMDKKLYGKVLGDRSCLEIDLGAGTENKTSLAITAYPLNAVGQKLMFGAREGVVPRVLEALEQEIQSRLDEYSAN